MMDPRIKAALDRLDHGSWSLTVAGFARRTLRMKAPMSPADRMAARDLMMASGLPHRRAPVNGQSIDVWDYDAP